MRLLEQRGGGCIPENIPDQVGWGSEQPALGVPAMAGGHPLKGPSQPKLLWFYDSFYSTSIIGRNLGGVRSSLISLTVTFAGWNFHTLQAPRAAQGNPRPSQHLPVLQNSPKTCSVKILAAAMPFFTGCNMQGEAERTASAAFVSIFSACEEKEELL